jgi:hypothetical protein
MENKSEDEDDEDNSAQGKKDYHNIISHLRVILFGDYFGRSIIPEELGVKICQKIMIHSRERRKSRGSEYFRKLIH